MEVVDIEERDDEEVMEIMMESLPYNCDGGCNAR